MVRYFVRCPVTSAQDSKLSKCAVKRNHTKTHHAKKHHSERHQAKRHYAKEIRLKGISAPTVILTASMKTSPAMQGIV